MIDGGNFLGLGLDDVAKWPEPDYGYQPRELWAVLMEFILFGLASYSMTIRLGMRLSRRAGNPGLDDLFIVLSWPGSLLFLVVSSLLIDRYQGGRSIWDVFPINYPQIAKSAWINEITFIYTTCCVKVSICLLYRRLVLGLPSRAYLYVVYAALICIVAITIALLTAIIFTCSPVYAYWEAFNYLWNEPYVCDQHSAADVNISAGVFFFITDLFVAFYPLSFIRVLKISKKDKIGLYFIFSLGISASAAAGVRTYYLYMLAINPDVSRMFYNAGKASIFEMHIGMIAANLPACRACVRMFIIKPYREKFGRLKSSSPTFVELCTPSDIQSIELGEKGASRNVSEVTERALV